MIWVILLILICCNFLFKGYLDVKKMSNLTTKAENIKNYYLKTNSNFMQMIDTKKVRFFTLYVVYNNSEICLELEIIYNNNKYRIRFTIDETVDDLDINDKLLIQFEKIIDNIIGGK